MLSLNAELASQMPEQSHFNLLCTAQFPLEFQLKHWQKLQTEISSLLYSSNSGGCLTKTPLHTPAQPLRKVTSRQTAALFSHICFFHCIVSFTYSALSITLAITNFSPGLPSFLNSLGGCFACQKDGLENAFVLLFAGCGYCLITQPKQCQPRPQPSTASHNGLDTNPMKNTILSFLWVGGQQFLYETAVKTTAFAFYT